MIFKKLKSLFCLHVFQKQNKDSKGEEDSCDQIQSIRYLIVHWLCRLSVTERQWSQALGLKLNCAMHWMHLTLSRLLSTLKTCFFHMKNSEKIKWGVQAICNLTQHVWQEAWGLQCPDCPSRSVCHAAHHTKNLFLIWKCPYLYGMDGVREKEVLF